METHFPERSCWLEMQHLTQNEKNEASELEFQLDVMKLFNAYLEAVFLVVYRPHGDGCSPAVYETPGVSHQMGFTGNFSTLTSAEINPKWF